MDLKYYVEILRSSLLPPADAELGDEWILQRDSAAVHSSSTIIEFLDGNDVQVLDWPSKPPVLNFIENLWGQIVCRIYANVRQYKNAV